MGVSCSLIPSLSLSIPSLPLFSALHDTRSKLLADVFYGSPGSTSLIENVHHEDYPMEEMREYAHSGTMDVLIITFLPLRNRQNPMFVQPYDNWQGVDASGPEST